MAGLEEASSGSLQQGTFATTHWSVVLAAQDNGSVCAALGSGAEAALEKLCRAYWYPLYAFVRRRGYDVHDAQDLTQEFFARLLSKDFLRDVNRSKGKFRSFLLAALEHFLANAWRDAHAQKRGGNISFIAFNDESGEQEYLQIASGPQARSLSAQELFDQQWATALLGQVLTQLRAEFVAADKEMLFDELKIFLTGEKRVMSYGEMATKLTSTEGALKMAVSRMRQRYGELLRTEIANTVGRPEDVDEELRVLVAALRA